jgi:deoxycytidylate deaminase
MAGKPGTVLGPIEDSELFIGLVGPVGTDWETAVDCISKTLDALGYTAKQVRLSDVIQEIASKGRRRRSEDEGQRIERLMRLGDSLRRKTQDGAIIAEAALQHVQFRRYEANQGSTRSTARRFFSPVRRYAYIFNSLKHPSEIDFLRRLYGDLFFAISLYSPRASRVDRLAAAIARSRKASNVAAHRETAERLVELDAKAGDDDLGQSVRTTFDKADFFVDMGDYDHTLSQIRRFLEIIFGHPFQTPTKSEYAMFFARGVGLRSADLSRQVGAILVNESGEVLGCGCNEVPQAGGGIVWADSEGTNDRRDFRLGFDSNSRKKHELIEEVINALLDEDWINKRLARKGAAALTAIALHGPSKRGRKVGTLEDTRVDNIIEFGRIVHAEMNALTEAARRGVPTKGADLYCTTFPCHMCARHLISAGIRRVYYIEPYPKSLVGELYDREITVEPRHDDSPVLQFRPFTGVAPRRYSQLFNMTRRKGRDGRALVWSEKGAQLRITPVNQSYIEDEMQVAFSAMTRLNVIR